VAYSALVSEALKAKEPDAAGLPARAAALAILSDVLRKRRALDVAVDTALQHGTLAPRDAAFARAIAGETLRRFGQLDAVLRHFMVKPPAPHRSGATTEILLAGACELLFLNVAPHAAVDGANRLAQADPKALHFKSLINAVLRRVAQEGRKIIAAQDAARLNTPDWLWERWRAAYGEATAHAIAEAHLPEPPLDLVFKGDISLDIPDAEKLGPNVLRLRGAGRVEELPGFKEGIWWVQDVAASMPARLFGDIAGKRVLDLCAAPGGKTMQLASFGAHVTAVDISKERLARVQENLARAKLKAELAAADIRDWQPKAPASFVLLDAPCTSTGTIRRHSDLPWIKGAVDVTASTTLQAEMLEAAAAMTAPGGLLIYVVCSLEPEEGVEQIEAFLEQHKDFLRVPLSAAETFNDEKLISRVGDLRTLPCHWAPLGGMDSFYAARLKRSV
jgi:16S rRNA (cytosine967-C5)-methyltransferase